MDLLWMATIVFIPFTTNMLATAATGRADVYAMYVGTMAICSGVDVLARSHPGPPCRTRATGCPSRAGPGACFRATGILVVCLVLVVLVPGVGMFRLLSLLLTRPLHALLTRRRSSRA